MLRYEGKSKDVLIKALMELLMNRMYDSECMMPIQEAIKNGICIQDPEIIKEMVKYNKVKDENEAMEMLLYISLIGTEVDETFFTHYKGCVKKLEIEEFNRNPYVKNIKFGKDVKASKNNVSFRMESYEPYEIFEGGFITRSKTFLSKPNINFFNEKVYYPAIFQDGKAWMTITPAEISTMKEQIQLMKGNVVIFGLGLGYFAYMSALKATVKSITIVELDQNIIDIFNECILPQFDEITKSKVKIVRGDAKEKFVDVDFMKDFDSCFIDIWRGIQDGISLYSYFKENENLHKIKPQYWIEKEFILRYQDSMFMYILSKVGANLEGAPKTPTSEMLASDGFLLFIFNKIENYFNNKKYILKDKTTLINLIYDKKIMNDVFKMKMS